MSNTWSVSRTMKDSIVDVHCQTVNTGIAQLVDFHRIFK